MDLYLIRHADALALGERGITEDAGRPLSELGEQQSQQVARILQKRGVVLDKLLTSPLVRARQTADIILRNTRGNAPQLHVGEDLAPGGKPRKLARFLTNLGGSSVGLVGHMPDIAFWAGWLIGGKRAQLEIAKAGIAFIACGGGPGKGLGVLHWLVTPDWYAD